MKRIANKKYYKPLARKDLKLWILINRDSILRIHNFQKLILNIKSKRKITTLIKRATADN